MMIFLDGIRFTCLLILPISGLYDNTVIEERLNHGLESLRELNLSDDNEIETFIKSYLNKAYIKKVGKKPFIKVLISRMA